MKSLDQENKEDKEKSTVESVTAFNEGRELPLNAFRCTQNIKS